MSNLISVINNFNVILLCLSDDSR